MAASDAVVRAPYADAIAPAAEARGTERRTLFRRARAFIEVTADLCACVAGVLATGAICRWLHVVAPASLSLGTVAPASVLFAWVAALMIHHNVAANQSSGPLRIRETERAICYSLQLLLPAAAACILFRTGISPRAFLIAGAIIPALLILEKQLFFSCVRRLQRDGRGIDRVVVYGPLGAARRTAAALLQAPRLGFRAVAILDEPHGQGPRLAEPMKPQSHSVPVLQEPFTAALLRACKASMLMVVAVESSRPFHAVAKAAAEAGVDLEFVQWPANPGPEPAPLIHLDGLLLSDARQARAGFLHVFAKRLVDLVISIALLIALAPLLALIAILIRLDSPGPAFFVQTRVGRNGVPFTIYKFRTMYAGTPGYDPSPTTSHDPRITRLGRFFRRASLDELPQLLNVFLGNMSLVGPRPEMPFIVERYTAEERQRLQATPGITGLWQLSPARAFPIHHNLDYDLYYIRHCNFFLDAAILVHTLFFAMQGGV